MAYQGALGLDVEEIRKKNEEIAPKPDLVIFLDIDPAKAIRRIEGRGRPDRFEDIGYLQKVREIFLSLNDEMVVIDTDESPEIVRKKVLDCVLSILT
jgi:dTMP kinase